MQSKKWPKEVRRKLDYPLKSLIEVFDEKVEENFQKTYLSIKGMKYTYSKIKELSLKVAAILDDIGIKKGAEKMIAKVDKNECTGCGICADECPSGAIKVNDVAVVDASLCTGCGACVDACPSGTLSMV